MKWFKSVLAITMQNFRKWKYDCRIWIALIMVVIFIHSVTKGLAGFCDYAGVKCAPWIFPFLYMNYYNKFLFFFPLILIFSNAPFMDKNQLYVLVRGGKTKWCIGQIGYIVIAGAVYFLFVMLMSVVLNLNCIEFSEGWGKVLNTFANTDAGFRFQIGFDAEADVVNMFSPLLAVWFTFLHSWISAIILGLVLFLFNMKMKGAGTFVASFLLVLSGVASKQISLMKLSPISWSTLNCIHLTANDRLPEYGYVSAGYGVILVVLVVLIIFVSKTFNFDSEIKR